MKDNEENRAGGTEATSVTGSGRHTVSAAALCVLVAAVLLGVFTVFFPWQDDPEKAERFDPVTTFRGSYVYLDIVSVSGRLLRVENSDMARFYHSAEDENGYIYIIRMNASDLSRFPVKYRQHAGSFSGTVPEPYRVYGKAVQMTDKERQELAGLWDIEPERVVDYFGHKCIDIDMSPANDKKIICGTLSLTFIIISVCALLIGQAKNNKT